MNKLKQLLLIIIGIISFVLGCIGIIIPVLPTVPFLLLTSYCFAKSSEKFHDYFVKSKIYKKYLESFVSERAMTFKQKVSLLIFSDIMIAFPLLILENFPIKVFLIMVEIFKYYYFIYKIKTIKIKIS